MTTPGARGRRSGELLDELDEAAVAAGHDCYCGRSPDICEDAGGCPASRAVASAAAAERERIKAAGAVSACCGAEYHREPGKYGRWQCHACGQQCDLIGTIG